LLAVKSISGQLGIHDMSEKVSEIWGPAAQSMQEARDRLASDWQPTCRHCMSCWHHIYMRAWCPPVSGPALLPCADLVFVVMDDGWVMWMGRRAFWILSGLLGIQWVWREIRDSEMEWARERESCLLLLFTACGANA
jgi:hypothetical protein